MSEEQEKNMEEQIEEAYQRIDGVLAQLKISRQEHDILKGDLDLLRERSLGNIEEDS